MALTNVREKSGSPPLPTSRGKLVLDLLRGGAPTIVDIVTAASTGDGRLLLPCDYAAFNLLVARLHADGEPDTYFLSNRVDDTASGRRGAVPLEPGVVAVRRVLPGTHALSNSTLDDDSWGKVGVGDVILQKRVKSGYTNECSLLFLLTTWLCGGRLLCYARYCRFSGPASS